MSRPKRWAQAVDDAQDALSRLVGLQEEYREWLEGLPENLEMSATGAKLEAVCDLEGVEELGMILGELESVDLPRGFGRD